MGETQAPEPELRADEEAPSDAAALDLLRKHKLRLEAPPAAREQGARPTWRRRTYFVDWKLQLSYAGLYVGALALLVLGIALSNYIFLVLVRRVEVAHQRSPGAAIANGPFFQAEDLGTYLVLNVVILVFVAIGMSVWAIVQSHKIAGPILRFRRALKEMLRRDYDGTINLRKGDHLKDMADDVNALAGALKAKDLIVADAALRISDLAAATADKEKACELRELADELSKVVLPHDAPRSA